MGIDMSLDEEQILKQTLFQAYQISCQLATDGRVISPKCIYPVYIPGEVINQLNGEARIVGVFEDGEHLFIQEKGTEARWAPRPITEDLLDWY